MLHIVIESDRPVGLLLVLTDFTGTIVRSDRFNLVTGSNTITENIGALAPGIYTLKLIKPDSNETIIRRFVKI